jgi:hypothetical protein
VRRLRLGDCLFLGVVNLHHPRHALAVVRRSPVVFALVDQRVYEDRRVSVGARDGHRRRFRFAARGRASRFPNPSFLFGKTAARECQSQQDYRCVPHRATPVIAFCQTTLARIPLSQEYALRQLGHRDGGKLVMECYGHPSEASARQRLLAAWEAPIGSNSGAREQGRQLKRLETA